MKWEQHKKKQGAVKARRSNMQGKECKIFLYRIEGFKGATEPICG